MEEKEKIREIVNKFLENNLLLSFDMKEGSDEIDEPTYKKIILLSKSKDFSYMNKDIFGILKQTTNFNFNWTELEQAKAQFEKNNAENKYIAFLEFIKNNLLVNKYQKQRVNVVSSFEELSSKREVQDFVMYFNSRLDSLQKILCSRDELTGLTSISRILAKQDRENVSLIGMVKDKQTTKNSNLVLVLEDSTGEIKVLVNKNKPEMYKEALDLVLDEVVGVSGVNGNQIVFANSIIWPDIPLSNELKKSEEEAYALFLSDLHVGSNNFLSEDFNRFLSWIKQEAGNEKQKEIASKVKYIFIIGDLVDGVGIYPDQEEDLLIKDVKEQYRECASLLSKIPQNINLIICPGNHDAVRLAEPQPTLENEFCDSLKTLPNSILVSNPSIVNIHSSKNFLGYNVLLYHGYSFDYFVANVDSIRNNGGYDRADLIMKFLLKRRHLAPTHASSLVVPHLDKDPLVVGIIPDFFATGHIHKSSVANYRNVTLICGSCWQSKTAFQEKVGHHPEPSRVPIVNLATRELKILRFGK